MEELSIIQKQFDAYRSQLLELNMTRGQPSDADLDLSLRMIDVLDREDFVTPSGTDLRNYPGGIAGLPEARALFCDHIGVAPDEIIMGNNSSLELMTSILQWALIRGVASSDSPWMGQSPKMIVTVPGYDRHFKLLDSLGFDLVGVDINEHGPDIDAVEKIAVADSTVKGIFFVPTYSNPTGDTISQAVAERLVAMPTAAADFTIFGDDAYAVHHLEDEPEAVPNLLAEAKAVGNAERVILFGSTSKVTFASAGLSFLGMSVVNMAYWTNLLGLQSIGPNKFEQWRHVQFLEKYPGGPKGLMRDHAKIIKPKFDAVDRILTEELGASGLATWTKPKGGYFVSFNTTHPVAKRVVDLAAEIGVAFTPAGATYPGGVDPSNSNIRLAPTRPPLAEVEEATHVFATCVKLASAEYLSHSSNSSGG